MRIIYLGNVGTAGTAMAEHTRNIARLLRALGNEVTFISSNPGIRFEKYDHTDEFKYLYTKKTEVKYIRTIQWYFETVTGEGLLNLLRKEERKEHIDLVILYGFSGQPRICRFCKKNKIKIIADRVDWFEPSDYKGLFAKWYCKHFPDKYIQEDDKHLDGIISISILFMEHYKKMGIKTIWIPPVFDKKEMYEQTSANSIYRIVYAGSLGAGKKDSIKPVVESLLSMNKEVVVIELHLIGISETQLNNTFGNHEWLNIGIYAYGRLPHNQTLDIVKTCDFGVLLRQNKRYAKAGFSTKFAECMCNSLPMICTKVGGADTIVTHMADGILLDNNNNETILNVLHRVSMLPMKAVVEMKKHAYETGVRFFSAHNYMEALGEFIDTL